MYLSDIAYEIRDNYTPNHKDNLPYIGLKHVEQGSLHISDIGSSQEVESNKFRFHKGDILFGTLRPYFRKVVIAPCDGVCSTELCVVRVNNDDDRYFVFYSMAHPQFIKYATANSKGDRPRTKWKLFSRYELPEFSPSHRKNIGKFLSCYDRLIENNRRRIELLEGAARLLYKEWFIRLRFPGHERIKVIDGVPEGWAKESLGNVVEVAKGKNIKKNMVKDGPVPVVAGGVTPAYYHDTSNVEGPVITISASGAAGFVNLYLRDIWASDCSYISSDVTDSIFFFYLLLVSRQREIYGLRHGTVQPHVYPKDIQRLSVLLPSKRILKSFEAFAVGLFKMIACLQKQNDALLQTRDLLLPRLMNGEVSV